MAKTTVPVNSDQVNLSVATFLSDLSFSTICSFRQPPTLNAFGRGKISHNAHYLILERSFLFLPLSSFVLSYPTYLPTYMFVYKSRSGRSGKKKGRIKGEEFLNWTPYYRVSPSQPLPSSSVSAHCPFPSLPSVSWVQVLL